MLFDKYYLGNLGLEENSSKQAKLLREIVLSQNPEFNIIDNFLEFILAQNSLNNDTIMLINKALMAHYGSEYLGLGEGDFSLKASLYKQFIDKFSEEPSFKFYCADCLIMSGELAEVIYPILKEGMLQDKTNANYPTPELFNLIHDSKYSFEFDIFLLEKYYQPCSKDTFDNYIEDYKEYYKSSEQQRVLENMQWKGN